MDRSKLGQVQLQTFHPEHSEVSLPVKLLQMATSLGIISSSGGPG